MSFKIAIIGGGGAGMICAYLLNKAGHQVSVFEKQDVLGGNIRTTNKNLHVDGLDKDLFLEGGVVEFPEVFHNFRKILDELGVKAVPVPVGSAFFPKNGKARLSREMIHRNKKGLQKIEAFCQFLFLQISTFPMWLRSRNVKPSELYNKSLDEVLSHDGIGNTWLKDLTMYSYSIPFRQIGNMPAEMVIPAMRNYMKSKWFRIEGGVYTYVEKILDVFKGQIICNSDIQRIQRTDSGVLISRQGREEAYDKVVFATPPDQVLKLLSDPTPDEVRRFNAWGENYAETIIHTDTGFYERLNINNPSEFDFFETENGWGYNAWLNGLCGIQGDTSYSLAYNLESLIDPEKIIHIQQHRTPLYSVKAFEFRNEIIETNGGHHTCHAGAYLGDGLHEGAAMSAIKVAELIGMG